MSDDFVAKATYPVDLQVHSTFSDGTETPTELVEHAVRRGIEVLALTDHDSVLGVAEAIGVGLDAGVTIVPALEFSTLTESTRDLIDINILAYGIRYQDERLQRLLQRVLENRIDQKVRQIQRLQSYGVDVPVDEVLDAAGGVPGRVHIANVAIRRNPQLFTTIDDVFRLYLAGDAPNSTYVARTFSLTVEDAIDAAHAAGGIAVLAHPGVYHRVRDIEGMIERLKEAGLDGLEISYTYAQNRGHKGASAEKVAALIAYFDALAEKFELVRTGGSDYHGATKPGILPGQAGLTHSQWEWLKHQTDLYAV